MTGAAGGQKQAGQLRRLLIMTHNMAGGGSERVIAILANALAADGVTVAIATEYRCGSFYALDPRVTLHALSPETVCRTRDIPKTYMALRRYAKSFRPDAILAMPEKVNVWAVLAMLGSGVPVVVSERNDPRVHPESRIKRGLRRILYPLAAGFIFQTEQARDYFPPRIRARGTVLDNPLDLSGVPDPHTGARLPCVVSAGRLHPQKNFPLLIRAFAIFHAAHPDWRLVIYGEGAEREALTRLAGALPDGAISLPGQSKSLLADIREAGMFVLSSDYEGMPNALIEAMAMGLACIASDCPAGGPRALIRDGENGLLVPIGDERALASAMARAASEPGLADRLGENALLLRERVRSDAVVQRWRETLEKAASIR